MGRRDFNFFKKRIRRLISDWYMETTLLQKIKGLTFISIILFFVACMVPVPCFDDNMQKGYEVKQGKVIRKSTDEDFKFEETENLFVYTYCRATIWDKLHTTSPDELENVLEDVEEILGMRLNGTISVYLMPGHLLKSSKTKRDAFSFSFDYGGKVFLPMSGILADHEFAHIIIVNNQVKIVDKQIVNPPNFFVEGTAVYVEHVRGKYPDIERPCEITKETITNDIEGYNRPLYASAGSFVKYLIETQGLEEYTMFQRNIYKNSSYSDIDRRFQKSYGISLEEALNDWGANQDFDNWRC